ncbi:putative toxin-antitoxin system toxin component, PIN family [Kyrpidia tusciae]|uniref:Nucleic acid-binding protein n=1 Tax=Kyrpidia tusciae (strain DSM 2912 / NBRC 15312 / T2) TaxID=562970 RepID=D5WVP4_KYRT2|nr:putative toxin-antitoxin system toxin component, PIN family [Kyrpidia tusciae]ADG07587.1 nucleic acid-binding protein [Kyrpidia tusciae DSM 2912]
MKAVIDTNIWVSGLISASGVPSRVIDAYRFRRFMWVTSDPLLDELATVLLA